MIVIVNGKRVDQPTGQALLRSLKSTLQQQEKATKVKRA